ncbi:MAG: hypothetical protein IH845_03415 [Nanoarchaeota archaeon]|nr:hypothetical protein [Nanoarchaeota archaeon]
MVTTIQIDESLKGKLDALKVHHRETYNELLVRLVGSFKPREDVESLKETLEIMSDPDLVRRIADSMERIEKGKYGISLDELEKELGD